MSLFKRGNVFWSYFYIDGLRHQMSTGTSNRRQAEAIEQSLKQQANLRRHHVVLSDPNLTFGALAAHFIAETGGNPYHVGRLKQILPFFADIPVDRIDRALVREYRAERMAKKTLTQATVNHDCKVLRHVLYWAVDEGLLLANPLARLHLPAERPVSRPVLSVREEQLLLEVAAEHIRPMIFAALYAGLRRGEVLSQRWEDIDFARGVLSVTRSKTIGGERREIPLATHLLKILDPQHTNGPVFTFKGRTVVTFRGAWENAVARALTRPLRFHDLRHTFNSRLMEAGVIQDVRKALMGHSTRGETNSVYTHVELPTKRLAIQKLDQWVALQQHLHREANPTSPCDPARTTYVGEEKCESD